MAVFCFVNELKLFLFSFRLLFVLLNPVVKCFLKFKIFTLFLLSAISIFILFIFFKLILELFILWPFERLSSSIESISWHESDSDKILSKLFFFNFLIMFSSCFKFISLILIFVYSLLLFCFTFSFIKESLSLIFLLSPLLPFFAPE